ncbi:hypothetical protein [Falsiroseomonas tokyonensis]|uniref:Uncharacterized protein n=1 Tax=Falsiroseomonas tokyonensis TaxID=430521 RepID=A0ABV7C2D9_9PROT|nr:hypothetical protein [Falsiroseomonas tokyonensis]MBU8540271.1 hypothetical protein [Falsiroseomonas tokyonensis]
MGAKDETQTETGADTKTKKLSLLQKMQNVPLTMIILETARDFVCPGISVNALRSSPLRGDKRLPVAARSCQRARRAQRVQKGWKDVPRIVTVVGATGKMVMWQAWTTLKPVSE